MIYYLIAINALSFYLMAIDKRRAKRKKWRIQESLLLTLALFGGSIGTLVAMNIFRHKTKHRSFRIGVPLFLLGQVLLVVFLKDDMLLSF